MRFTILVGAGEDYLQHLDVNEAEENGGDLLDGTHSGQDTQVPSTRCNPPMVVD